MDGGARVRVLWPRQRPVECRVSAMSNLIQLYGGGNLRDSNWTLFKCDDDNLPPGYYTYVCALQPDMVSALRQVQEPLILPTGDRKGLCRGLADIVYSYAQRDQPSPIRDAFLDLLRLADEAWLQGLIAVIGEDYKTDALPALIGYASSNEGSPVRVQCTASVANMLVQAWSRPFEDPLGVVDYLFGELQENVKLWSEDLAYHAAWTVLLQSSGWGKSRTVCELHTKGVHVVYLSFLSMESSGYPGGSAVSRMVLDDAGDPRFVAAWVFSILPELVGKSPTDWMKLQMGATSAQELADRVRTRYGKLRKEVGGIPQSIPREGEEWDNTALKAWVREQTDDNKLGAVDGMKVLIHIDEAASFFSQVPGSFLATRRFFSCISRGSWIFGLVSDTAGKLGLVFPEKMYDVSARARRAETKFFKPLWVVGTLWGDGKQLQQLMNQAEDLTIPSEGVTKELFKWGRPLWRCSLEGAGEAAGTGAASELDDVVGFAIQKLLGGITLTALHKNPDLMTTAMGMAILGVAAGLELVAWSDLAKDTVANHMRTVSYIGGERDLVYSADAVEPILGEVAGRILRHNLGPVLKVAEGVFKQGYVVEGPRGEIVGRLVMVLAMHTQCRKTSIVNAWNVYSHPVKLQDFLTTLCGVDVESPGLVCFNRFIMLNRREITRQHLLLCFICCMAIIPRRGQVAFDAMIPMLMPGSDGKYDLTADRMVGLPVQIRNRICTSVESKPLARSARKFFLEDPKKVEEKGEGSIASSDSKGPKEVVEEKDEGNIASSDSKDPKETTEVAEDEEEDDTDDTEEDDTDDTEVDDTEEDPDYIPDLSDGEDKEPVKKRSKIVQNLKLDLPLGIYIQLGGTKADHELDDGNGNILILHGLNYSSFLEVQDLKSLKRLRSAFFRLEDHLEGKQWTIVRQNLSNYFMPQDLQRLTKKDLQRHCKGLGIKYSGREQKQELVILLKDAGLEEKPGRVLSPQRKKA